MATLKVDTITSDTLPTVSITDGASISGVTTFSSNLIANSNIGIGTDNPQRKLEVWDASESNIRIEGGADYFELRVKDSDNAFGIHKNIAGGGSSEVLRITSAGHVQVRYTQSATTGGAPLYVGVTGKSNITYGGGQDDTACVRIEDEGGTNSYYHGLELRTKQGGDVRLYAHDGGNDVADLVIATDNSGIVERLRITSGGQLSTGAETAPDVSAGGLCLNQGAADTNIFSLKSSDIAHGVTTYDETDTYFSIRKGSGDKGGARIHGFTDAAGGDAALEFQGIINSDADQGYCPIEFRGSEANGTGVQNIAADRRILNIKNSDGTRIASFTGTGLTFGNDSATANALDDYEEGQWTVQLTGASSGTSNDGTSGTGFDTASGVYTKVGNTCYFTMHLANVHDGDCTGDLRFSLPFTASNGQSSTTSLRMVGACVFSGVNYTASGQANVYIESGDAFATIAETIDNTTLDFINESNVDNDANDIYLSGFFFV